MDEQITQTVINALEDNRYKWRTIKGIVKQTNMPEEIISRAISILSESGKVVQSSVPSKDGQQLFTTRTHYRKKSPITSRLSAILRNRGA